MKTKSDSTDFPPGGELRSRPPPRTHGAGVALLDRAPASLVLLSGDRPRVCLTYVHQLLATWAVIHRAYESQTTTRMLGDSVLDLVEMEIRVSLFRDEPGMDIAAPACSRTYDSNGSAR